MIARELLGLSFQIDTNRINARGSLPSMNRLEKWARDGLIEILLSEPAMAEAIRGGSRERQAKAYSHIFTLDTFQGCEEAADQAAIAQALFPGGVRTASQESDVRIVAHAKKYMCKLVTADGGSKRQPGGILGRRRELRQLGVEVLTDLEAVALVEERIRRRDNVARMCAAHKGEPLPDWVDADS